MPSPQPFVGSTSRMYTLPKKNWGKAATTPEQRQWAIDLHHARPELTSAEIARMMNREFGTYVNRDRPGYWFKREEQQ